MKIFDNLHQEWTQRCEFSLETEFQCNGKMFYHILKYFVFTECEAISPNRTQIHMKTAVYTNLSLLKKNLFAKNVWAVLNFLYIFDSSHGTSIIFRTCPKFRKF